LGNRLARAQREGSTATGGGHRPNRGFRTHAPERCLRSGDTPKGSIMQRIGASRGQIEYCIELIRNLAFLAEYTRDPEAYRRRHPGKVTVIPQVLIQAALFFQEMGRQKQVKIHLVDRDSQFKVNADPDLLRQVFINLFEIARTFSTCSELSSFDSKLICSWVT
jgi:signal transduction histidine kinase